MKQRRVVTTPEADEDATRIDQWWVQNRGAAPNLFVEVLRFPSRVDLRTVIQINGVARSPTTARSANLGGT
jgi:hypothetical protein